MPFLYKILSLIVNIYLVKPAPMNIKFHMVVENQLEVKDPIEVYQFDKAIRRQKYPHHDKIHLIGAILVPFIFSILMKFVFAMSFPNEN